MHRYTLSLALFDYLPVIAAAIGIWLICRYCADVGGRKGACETPWYVADKDLGTNTLVVVQGHDHPLLFRRRLWASQLHWVSGTPPAAPVSCRAKVRYRQREQPCTIIEIATDTCQVVFEQPQRSVTPGQSVVFYAGAVCLGGGVIEKTATM